MHHQGGNPKDAIQVVAAQDEEMEREAGRGQDEDKGAKKQVVVPHGQLPVPLVRLRKKTTLHPAPAPKPKQGTVGGNSSAKGKKRMASIFEKEAIMAAYETAVKNGDRKPVKAIEKMPGYFPGCVYPSKWGSVRQHQQWAVLVQTAPKICKKFKELPNSLRMILRLDLKKGGFANQELWMTKATKTIPPALETAFESLVVERIDLGEEVSITYIKNMLLEGCRVWNRVVSGTDLPKI